MELHALTQAACSHVPLVQIVGGVFIVKVLKFKHVLHLTSCFSQLLRTNHQWQTARRPYKLYTVGLRSLQVRVVHKQHS